VIVQSRTWKGGSSYEIIVSPERLVDRLPLPGEDVDLGEMGRVRVMSAHGVERPDWLLPRDRLWRLVVQTRGIGPDFDNL
jgi:hypothetical protein